MQEVELVHDTEFSWLSSAPVLGVVAVAQVVPFHVIAKVSCRWKNPSE